MIPLLTHLAAEKVLYHVSLDNALAIPIASSIVFFGVVLIKEFTKGWLRYLLAFLYVGSFSATWFILLMDDTPFNFILILIMLVTAVSGLWNWARDIVRDIRKL